MRFRRVSVARAHVFDVSRVGGRTLGTRVGERDDAAVGRAQKMKEKEDKKKALAEKRAARDAARKAKKAGEGEGGDA